MSKRKTIEEFIEKAKEVHGDRYNYSKVYYINNNTKVEILCSSHGSFLQKPNNHLNGQNCPECGKINTGKSNVIAQKDVISEFIKTHGSTYDYSLVE